MNLENFDFTYEENEEGYTVTLKGDKEKLKRKLEAFEAFLNFREKAKAAGFEHPGSGSPFHQFIRAMHKNHGAHSGQGGHHGHCGHHGHHGHHGYHGHHGHCESQRQDVASGHNEGENKQPTE
jgi:hypothetical protein